MAPLGPPGPRVHRPRVHWPWGPLAPGPLALGSLGPGSLRPMPLGPPWGPMPLGPPWGPPMGPHAPGPHKRIFCIRIILIFFKSIIAEKNYTPPPFFKMKLEDPEPILKVYIPVFQPPGHSIDGLGLF